MPTKPARGRLEKELEALHPALADPESLGAREILRGALLRSHSLVATKAAVAIRDRGVPGFDEVLAVAFDRFLKDPVKTDPGCRAKLAVVEALDFLQTEDTGPFLRAVRCFQREAAFGGPVDTASGVRARGALALARLGHPDFFLLMGELLADPEPPVREAAADALAHRGDPAGAGLVELKIRVGDEEPMVILACLASLISLAPTWGVVRAGELLEGEAPELREVAAIALGESRREDALDRIFTAYANEVHPRRRGPLLRAMAAHRGERALEKLLAVIAEGGVGDARTAIEALTARRPESSLVARVRDAAARNESADLSDALRAACAERDPS